MSLAPVPKMVLTVLSKLHVVQVDVPDCSAGYRPCDRVKQFGRRNFTGLHVVVEEFLGRSPALGGIWAYVLRNPAVPGIFRDQNSIDQLTVISGPVISLYLVAPTAGVNQVEPVEPQVWKQPSGPEMVYGLFVCRVWGIGWGGTRFLAVDAVGPKSCANASRIRLRSLPPKSSHCLWLARIASKNSGSERCTERTLSRRPGSGSRNAGVLQGFLSNAPRTTPAARPSGPGQQVSVN